jgi:hypothetical protein
VRSDAQGVLVIWNDIAEAWETEFLNWHVREHMPERVALPGFLRGQRYIAVEGTPKYFNFYEATDAAVFSSNAYRERLNAPTPWTRRVVTHFANTGRTICQRVAHAGQGDGAFVETRRLSVRPGTAFETAAKDRLLPQLIGRDGIVAATLLQGIPVASGSGSAEKTLRSQPDEVADWVLLTEAVAPGFLLDVGYLTHLETELRKAGAQADAHRGVYQLQFALSRQ